MFTALAYGGKISSSVYQVGDNLFHLLHFVEDLPRQDQNLLVSGEYLVKSLTCNDLGPFLSDLIPTEPPGEGPVVTMLPVEDSWSALQNVSMPQSYTPPGYLEECH
ncbi:hypothetical protein DSO57_1010488 [Entomophthora muscae]|uniref:Uncharacterized protein n=1 Tax=Entomophthora muscae TaxID=34485 RepID=A0ACC2SJM3_9FUNG|nr:hypothetical protein DSO57_1010488 [Entomophthora muscae]